MIHLRNPLFLFKNKKIVKLDLQQKKLLVPVNLIELEHQSNEESTK
jgi:hypothetical protein